MWYTPSYRAGNLNGGQAREPEMLTAFGRARLPSRTRARPEHASLIRRVTDWPSAA
jgi:hypothetical protein